MTGCSPNLYDAESRLISVKQGSTAVASYAYDAQGRRKSKTVGSTTTDYVTDAANREVLEYDGTSGALERWYAFGRGPDAVLGQMNVAAGTRETMIPDIEGSIIGTLNSGTGALAKSGYQPFGENSAILTGTYRYTARRFDPETAGSTSQPSGLYYYRARTYSPNWGRFLQPDPIGYAGGANLYAYVGNDPLNQTDPFGTCDNPQGCGGSSNQIMGPTTLTPPSATASVGLEPNVSISNPNVILAGLGDVTFGHGGRHVDNPAAAQEEILNNLPNPAEIGGRFWGITPNYTYRAFPLPNGTLHIGTYYYR